MNYDAAQAPRVIRDRYPNDPTSVLEPVDRWDRKVTPTHFVAVVVVCGVFGFGVSVAGCRLVASLVAKRAHAALSDAFNLD